MTISLIRGLLIYAQDHFDEAVELVGSEFVEMVKYYTDDWWSAKHEVERAVKERKKVSCSRIKDKLRVGLAICRGVPTIMRQGNRYDRESHCSPGNMGSIVL